MFNIINYDTLAGTSQHASLIKPLVQKNVCRKFRIKTKSQGYFFLFKIFTMECITQKFYKNLMNLVVGTMLFIVHFKL